MRSLEVVVVPEFGTIAMIVLAVAIVSIIAITAKTRTALIPKTLGKSFLLV